MSKTYFGFAIADGMFPSECSTTRWALELADAKVVISNGVVSCLNSSHEATVVAMKSLGLNVGIPAEPPKISLRLGDRMLVMSVRGLPRLTENRHYTEEEVSKATFVFGLWQVLPPLEFRAFLADGCIDGGGHIDVREPGQYFSARSDLETMSSPYGDKIYGIAAIEKVQK
jgi:hypothetical protein